MRLIALDLLVGGGDGAHGVLRARRRAGSGIRLHLDLLHESRQHVARADLDEALNILQDTLVPAALQNA